MSDQKSRTPQVGNSPCHCSRTHKDPTPPVNESDKKDMIEIFMFNVLSGQWDNHLYELGEYFMKYENDRAFLVHSSSCRVMWNYPSKFIVVGNRWASDE